MGGRQLCETLEQDLGLLPILHRYLGVVPGILDGCCRIFVQFFSRPAPQLRKRLVAGNRKKPGRNLGSALESSGLTPNVQEHFADEVFSSRLVNEAQEKPVDAYIVPCEQNPHGTFVAGGNRLDQSCIGFIRRLSRNGSGIEPAHGVVGRHGLLASGFNAPCSYRVLCLDDVIAVTKKALLPTWDLFVHAKNLLVEAPKLLIYIKTLN